MGYFRSVEYGDIVDIYTYEKDISTKPKKHISAYKRKRQKQLREHIKATGTYKRTKRSINRSRQSFFRLCHHNNVHSDTIHFLTLTFAYDVSYKKALLGVRDFFSRVQKAKPEISLRYISVSEQTKAGRYHFHMLLYDLPPQTETQERETRNFQRLFGCGYVDIRIAAYNSIGIAGYMAKYMAKTLGSANNASIRGFNCSRNIKKGTSIGFNSVDEYTAMSIPTTDVEKIDERVYDVPYLGQCQLRKFRKIIN